MNKDSNNEQQQLQQQQQDQTSKVYPPSRYKMADGKKWRLCAAAAVLNSQNYLLVGERVSVKDSWQAPQGGVDEGETITEAAIRELYEEMGLVLDEHVVLLCNDAQSEEGNGYRYETTGTKSWLTKLGYAGQELHWVLFRSIDDILDKDPDKVCDLEGKNGEHAEFSNVKWSPVETVIGEVWEKKKDLYMALGEKLRKL